ncbi:MAG: DUF374 domain-containing protein [Verrucomicrobia bacterium]|nr:MAG: DUF374 domain-containing protein [Verrucomicrobiota bacterium]
MPNATTPPAPKKSGIVVPHAPAWHQRLAAWILGAALRVVSATLRYSWDNRTGETREQTIFCVWHNRLALCMKAYFNDACPRGRHTAGLAALISASKDGAFLAAVLEQFGVQPVRGSSSRRGAQALRELTSWARKNHDIAITPDGPRGPCYVAQDGVLALAQITGLRIVPVSYSLNWKIRLKSWDRFLVPLPFARCEMIYGRPLRVPREATPAEREELRRQLEAELKAITRD